MHGIVDCAGNKIFNYLTNSTTAHETAPIYIAANLC
jgi:hypothetical protein